MSGRIFSKIDFVTYNPLTDKLFTYNINPVYEFTSERNLTLGYKLPHHLINEEQEKPLFIKTEELKNGNYDYLMFFNTMNYGIYIPKRFVNLLNEIIKEIVYPNYVFLLDKFGIDKEYPIILFTAGADILEPIDEIWFDVDLSCPEGIDKLQAINYLAVLIEKHLNHFVTQHAKKLLFYLTPSNNLRVVVKTHYTKDDFKDYFEKLPYILTSYFNYNQLTVEDWLYYLANLEINSVKRLFAMVKFYNDAVNERILLKSKLRTALFKAFEEFYYPCSIYADYTDVFQGTYFANDITCPRKNIVYRLREFEIDDSNIRPITSYSAPVYKRLHHSEITIDMIGYILNINQESNQVVKTILPLLSFEESIQFITQYIFRYSKYGYKPFHYNVLVNDTAQFLYYFEQYIRLYFHTVHDLLISLVEYLCLAFFSSFFKF